MRWYILAYVTLSRARFRQEGHRDIVVKGVLTQYNVIKSKAKCKSVGKGFSLLPDGFRYNRFWIDLGEFISRISHPRRVSEGFSDTDYYSVVSGPFENQFCSCTPTPKTALTNTYKCA